MRGRILLALTLLLFLAGCAAKTGDESLSGCAPGQEERLVVYTSHKEEVYWPIIKEFEQRTGIWVEVVSGGTSEILERIAKEGDAPVADVMFGGGVESLESYRDCFTPYTCGQAQYIQDVFREPEDVWTPFSALPVVLIYNTKLVGPEQVASWRDLFSTEFRGRIAFAAPDVSGSSFTGLVTMLYALGGDSEQLLQRFAQQVDGQQLSGSGEVVSCVAEGTALVGITLEETALKRMAAGDDIALVYPEDGTSCVPDASALVKGAPHEENAKRFLDFTVSREVQQLLVTQFCRRPVRGDVEPVQQLADLDSITLVDYDVGWASRNRDGVLMTWAFYLDGEGEP